MSSDYDVAIVGSGIVGLGAAFAAVQRGKSVVVIDRASEPSGATIRNFGHLCFGAQGGTAAEYARASRPIWLTLAERAGFWVRASGTLVLAQHPDELDVLRAAEADDLRLLSRAEIERRIGVRPGVAVGGAHITPDLQVDPRKASAAIRSYLGSLGVTFMLRTSVGAVTTGSVHTSRGKVTADLVVVAVNHDLDQLLPDLAESAHVERCGLDMLRVRAAGVTLPAPLLTGWSLLRYGRFAHLDEVETVRARLHTARPDLAAIDLNQMYTQLPNGSVIVGDTHVRDTTISPFQSETSAKLLLDEFEALFGASSSVIERWQGVYASGPEDFLVAEPEPDVVVLTATTGIGMTTGLGLAELTLAPRLGTPADSILEGARP